MLAGRWLLDLAIAVYGLAVSVMFIDVVRPTPAAGRTAFVFLNGAFLLFTAAITVELVGCGSLAAFVAERTRLLYAWLLLAASLLLSAVVRADLFLLLTNAVGLAVVTLNLFPPGAPAAGPSGREELLVLHIVGALVAYVLFVLAGVFSVLYLLLDGWLAAKRIRGRAFRMPPLEQLARYAGAAALVGVPVFAVSLFLGGVWAFGEAGFGALRDPKVGFSGAVLLAYGFFVYVRTFARWPWRRAMWVGAGAFLLLWLNFWTTHSLALAAWPG
ncbi:MAG: cytochrome c biogenesis protein CcsA [Hydrogenibacillus schlegelii]|nr:cytochrome c biogenesis protein CcsA [Hydrogenibacillus schlegelii]